jgi:type IV pilus assembly protein PilN
MKMINLLNWREKQIQIQNNRFFLMIGAAVLVSFFLIMFVDLIVRDKIGNSQNNVKYLDGELSKIDEKISVIRDFQQQKDLLVSRRAIIDLLQESRPMTVNILDNLSKVIPNGIVLNELSRKGDILTLSGVGDSNSAISNLMKNIARLKWAKDAKLSEIKTMDQTTKGSQTSKNIGPETAPSPDSQQVSFKLDIYLVASGVPAATSTTGAKKK